MVIGTATGLSNAWTIALSIALAFVFGYSLTMLPLLRSGLVLAAVVPLAFASDTISIAVMEVVDGTEGLWLLAPAERIGSALQGALMVREGPRRIADGCETGDWNHVDVYLTKTLDYRALLFTGSRFDADALRWMGERNSHVVAVGDGPEGVSAAVRYPGEDDPIVALLTEIVVAELLAAQWWLASTA